MRTRHHHTRRFIDERSPVERAAWAFQLRRRRDQLFAQPDLFGEPAYDILLDLYVSQHEGRQVTISDACNAAHVPWTTAVRQVRKLHALGLVLRLDDDLDRRRCYVVLDPKTLSMLDQLFELAR